MMIDMGQSNGIEAYTDTRVWLCMSLSLVYVFEVMNSVYCLIKFVHLAANDSINRIDNLLQRTRALLKIVR